MNYCIVDKRTPSLRGEVPGADTTGARGRESVQVTGDASLFSGSWQKEVYPSSETEEGTLT